MKKVDINKEQSSGVSVERNIETIVKLEKEALKNLSAVEHIAEKVTTFAGSSGFIILHIIWFSTWILLNGNVIKGFTAFDPFPFSFLTLVVSLEAIFLTLLVLMTQNRMTKEADKQAKLDLQINMLDEQETTLILKMVQKISTHLGLEDETDDCVNELTEHTDIDLLAKSIDKKRP